MIKSTGIAKVTCVFGLFLLLTAPQIVLACVWYPHTAITDVDITAPADGAKIAVGTEVGCSCTEETDTDKRVAGETTYPGDDLTYTWSKSRGTWKNGVNTGRNVTWIAPDTPSGSVNGDWIKVAITDAAVIPPGESGDRDDPDETDTIHVTVVKVDLDIAGTTEENEETLGGFVAVNDDDDDDDDIVDKDDASVAGEDDLRAITLQQVLPVSLPGTDTVTLTWTNDAKIDVFEGSNKSTPVSSGAEYQLNTLPKTLYVEGDVVSGSVRDIEMKLEYLGAQGTCEDKVKVTVVSVGLKQVSFSGDNYHVVSIDTGGTYSAPHWQDNSSPLDGDEDDAGDRKYPACFKRNTKMKTSVKIIVAPTAAFGGTVKIRGDGPGNLDIPETTATVNGNEVTITNVEWLNAFPNHVKWYGGGDILKIKWYISRDGGETWFGTMRSDNEVFVTLDDPACATDFRTVLYLATEAAAPPLKTPP